MNHIKFVNLLGQQFYFFFPESRDFFWGSSDSFESFLSKAIHDATCYLVSCTTGKPVIDFVTYQWVRSIVIGSQDSRTVFPLQGNYVFLQGPKTTDPQDIPYNL